MKFTYSSGQRPLDGYTLKRGIGRGGFGEVYFAVSDGGKEVALKLVTGENQDVELRGIAQCLNLKHPNLVNLYDLRTDGQGDSWVVMEYVAGETLNVVLNRHPKGLPPEMAKQWFSALAKGVACLHDHGIVHRDLKPGNIFLENGMVKVGDYGLSKFITGSQRNAQTQSVGTVHYMAPEISTGNYNKQVDIYAAGIILYEMLTGRVPFDGESAGEILMKHLTTPPDLSVLPRDFATVIGKALAKNPAHRYQSMGEMARAVASVGGDRIPTVEAALPIPPVIPVTRPAPPLPPRKPEPPAPVVIPAQSLRGRIGELAGSMAATPIFAALFAILFAAVAPVSITQSFGLFFLTVAVSWAVLIPAKFWSSRTNESWSRRLVMLGMGLGVGLLALWLSGWVPHTPLASPPPVSNYTVAYPESPVPSWSVLSTDEMSKAARYLSYFGLAFCLMRWWKVADRRRTNRFGVFPVLASAFWSTVLLVVWPWPDQPIGAVALVLASVIVQLVSPWEQPVATAVKRMRLRCA